MRTLNHTIAGEQVTVFYPESRPDLAGFWAFLSQGDKVICVDSETTGLGIYEHGFKLRLVQFGNRNEAWVLRADQFADAICRALRQKRHFTLHNAPYDLQVFDRHLGVTIEELNSRCFDTRIMAHLLDPRQQHEGGTGLSLKPLSAIYVDEAAPDTQEGLTAEFRKIKNPDTGRPCTKDNGWAHIPYENDTYVLYAGLDVILGRRLFDEIAPLIRDTGLSNLSTFEHHFQGLVAIMQRKGVRIDVEYTERLKQELLDEQEHYRQVAAKYGVDNVNSTAQVAEALAAMGEELTETTPSGAVKVDKGVLLPLADYDQFWDERHARTPNPLARAVLHSKRAGKWAESYAQAFLDMRDDQDRLHASIGTLQARTARMSISRPPLQQLPSKDWKVRRAVVANPGHVFVSADYDQIEMRVLGALADVKGIKEAVAAGHDLHNYTARLVYGEDFTDRQRGLMKGVGFGKVYGGGAATLSRQTGAPIDAVRDAIAEYDRVYPEIKAYARRLQSRAQFGKREVVTLSGRHLPLDRDRVYSATNYVVQSTARDILAQAIVDCFDAGIGHHLCLPIHDELLAEVPEGEAEEVAQLMGKVMSQDFYGVHLTAAGEITGRNWGAAYVDKDHPNAAAMKLEGW